ncbi:MAG: tripartite tricarboxylate transporter permease [Kiritimatiellae bacterium]|jgi:putative membrane protein|nr:tripartite tricarboxylate transporter permease [Kiritimatiellia bacterium]MDD4341924.1 tripartite tricarboxylate transporter permease [Kiritimatiellia bacterium]MDY0149140.1 tripartite tricarboxylate transporter permease [Kiritimatiellia bacterium]
MSEFWIVLLSVSAGTVLMSVLSCLPGLHVYNLMGALVLGILALDGTSFAIPAMVYLPAFTGMIVSWAILNTIPAVLLGTPDESALFTVMPGQKYLMAGRGFEGTMITAVGGLAGAFFIVCVMAPLAPRYLPVAQQVLKGHMHWVLWIIITFMLMSEWPKGGNRGPAGWAKFFDAWKTLIAGVITFLLAGLLGFIILTRSPVSHVVAFQNIMPAFVGLFAIPWCLLNIISAASVPPQHTTTSLGINGDVVLRSVWSGALGGGIAAYFPIVTGGVGGMLAGHATAQRDERIFIMGQGVSKFIYYVGAFMLMFVPGLHLTRGGGAWMTKTLFTPLGWADYYLVIGCIAIAAAISYLMMEPLAKVTLKFINRFNYRHVSSVALAIILLMVLGVTGWVGMFIATVATGIGLLPVLFGSRRLNCLGILLLPIACNMSGFGETITGWLGLT